MSIEVVRSIGALEELAAGWNEILLESSNRNPYITPEWIANWWRFYGGGKELYVLVLADGDGLNGLCPLMVVKRRLYREMQFIGRPQVSRMGFVAKRGCEEALIRQVINHLIGLKDRYIFNLQGLCCDDSNYNLLKKCLRGVQYAEQTIPLYQIDLAHTPQQEFFRARKRHSTIQRTFSRERSLSRLCNLTFEKAGPGEVPVIFAIHDKRWLRKNDGNGFAKGISRSFFEHMAQHADHLPWDSEIHLLKADGKPIGFLYGLLYRGSYTGYRIAHDDDFGLFKPGMIMVKRMIEESYAKGYELLDFSTGYEPYKAYWTDDHVQIGSLCFGTGGLLVRVLISVRDRVYRLRQTTKKVGFLARFKRNTIGEIKYFLSGRLVADLFQGILLAWRQKRLACLLGNRMEGNLGADASAYRIKQEKTFGNPVTLRTLTIGDMDQIIDLTKMDGKQICKRYLDGSRCMAITADGTPAGIIWKTNATLTLRGKTVWKPEKQGDACFYDLCFYNARSKTLCQDVLAAIGNERIPSFACSSYVLLGKRQKKKLAQAGLHDRLAGTTEAG